MAAVGDIVAVSRFNDATMEFLGSEGAFRPPRSGDSAFFSANVSFHFNYQPGNMRCGCLAKYTQLKQAAAQAWNIFQL